MNKTDQDGRSAATDQGLSRADSCSAIELAAVLRSAKHTGTMVGNVIDNLGLVKYAQKKRWSKLYNCEFVVNKWFDEKTAPLAEVDIHALVDLCKSGKINRVRQMGAKGIALLWKTLGLPMHAEPRCACCGQLLPKHMVDEQNVPALAQSGGEKTSTKESNP